VGVKSDRRKGLLPGRSLTLNSPVSRKPLDVYAFTSAMKEIGTPAYFKSRVVCSESYKMIRRSRLHDTSRPW
jgi:hypothetical protein